MIKKPDITTYNTYLCGSWCECIFDGEWRSWMKENWYKFELLVQRNIGLQVVLFSFFLHKIMTQTYISYVLW